jgi:hypothetical protein
VPSFPTGLPDRITEALRRQLSPGDGTTRVRTHIRSPREGDNARVQRLAAKRVALVSGDPLPRSPGAQSDLSGGEPLAHPDFFLLGSRARDLGFVVRVKSNGHALRGAALLLSEPVLVETAPVLSSGSTARPPIRQTGCRISLREERRSCALKSAFSGPYTFGLRVHSAMPSVGYALGAPASACISPRE